MAKKNDSILDSIIPVIGEILSPSETSSKKNASSKKTTAKKTTAKKTSTAKKTTASKKTTAKKSTATKKTSSSSAKTSTKTAVPDVFTVQVGKKKFTYAAVVKKITSSYKDKIKDLDITVKTDEGKAYYVINGEDMGSVNIWR
ncbi:MAG: hypothetical protein J6U23_03475 [Clostridiales bacterium]|nr:hypothetical protein [Clostridiales bacterium]